MAWVAVRAWRGAAGQGSLSTAGIGEERARLPRPRRRSSLRLGLTLSALLHLALLLALLFAPQPRLETATIGEPGTVDVVMLPPAGVPEAPVNPNPEPKPATPVLPVPASAPIPAPAPPPAPEAAAPPVEKPPPAPEAAAPPVEKPPPPRAAAAPPIPPPHPPAPARPAPLRSMPFPRPIARSFADLSADLGARQPSAAPPPLPRGSMDLAIGPQARASNGEVPVNPDTPRGMVRIEGADLGEDWERALQAWWDRHGFYPRQAAENGEDGTNRLRVVLDRTGRVHSVELEMRSGSQWLDMGSQAIFRDAKLPPFPLATPQNEAILHLTITYILIRRGGG